MILNLFSEHSRLLQLLYNIKILCNFKLAIGLPKHAEDRQALIYSESYRVGYSCVYNLLWGQALHQVWHVLCSSPTQRQRRKVKHGSTLDLPSALARVMDKIMLALVCVALCLLCSVFACIGLPTLSTAAHDHFPYHFLSHWLRFALSTVVSGLIMINLWVPQMYHLN